MQMDQAIVAAISAGSATLLTALGNFLLNRKKVNHEIEQDELQKLFSESQKMRQELQAEILSMREQLLKLQEGNLKYAVSNAELNVQVKELQADLDYLKKFILDNIKDVNPDLLKAHPLITEKKPAPS